MFEQGTKSAWKHRYVFISFVCGMLTTYFVSQSRSAQSFKIPKLPAVRNNSSSEDTKGKDAFSAIKWMQDEVDYEKVMMDPLEINLLLKYLSGAKTYLEWGSGGSTLNFAKFPSGRVVSIEHHKQWCEKMPGLLEKEKLNDKVEYHCVPVNHENSEGRYYQYREYVNEIDRLNQATWDFVLVDGRARVSCAIKALSYLHETSIVIVHDFERVTYSGDDDYSRIFQYYNVLDRVGDTVKYGQGKRGLGVLRRKQKFDHLQGNTSQVQVILDDLSSIRKI